MRLKVLVVVETKRRGRVRKSEKSTCKMPTRNEVIHLHDCITDDDGALYQGGIFKHHQTDAAVVT